MTEIPLKLKSDWVTEAGYEFVSWRLCESLKQEDINMLLREHLLAHRAIEILLEQTEQPFSD